MLWHSEDSRKEAPKRPIHSLFDPIGERRKPRDRNARQSK